MTDEQKELLFLEYERRKRREKNSSLNNEVDNDEIDPWDKH